jgi:hypothetical protein
MTTLRPWLILAAAFAGGAAAVLAMDRAAQRFRDRREALQEDRLRERVKDEVAILVSHADAVEVTVDGGLVRVSGYVLATELDGLLSRLPHLPGVHKVHNALSAVADPARFDELTSPGTEDDPRGQAYNGA